ncbi:cyclin-dependent kinase 12 [Rhincodon typus]|uniref:cyclin-dependent kinase 12 n=1 Tax=Rhincodon typus TaxID=259920 RepID=UPI00202EF2BF|nr:cyclin-dependent kinase 12 [Rhincodon typus]
MPGSERAGTKADGSSGLGSLQPGPSSGRERRKAASRHKRHRTKHSRDSPGAAAQTPLTKVKSLVEYDDISSESDTFSEVTVRSERREKEERVSSDKAVKVHKHHHHHTHKRVKEHHKMKEAERVKDRARRPESGKSRSSRERTSSKRQVMEDEDSGKKERTSPLSKHSSKESKSAKSYKERGKKEERSTHKERTKSQKKNKETPRGYRTSPSPKKKSGSPRRKHSSSPNREDSPIGPYGKGYDASPVYRSRTSSNYDGYRRSPGDSSRKQSASPPYYGSREPTAYQSGYNMRSPSPYGRRQRSSSPYSRHRSPSYDRHSSSYDYSGRSPSPYSRRRSVSPYSTRRSFSQSPLARRSAKSRSRSPVYSRHSRSRSKHRQSRSRSRHSSISPSRFTLKSSLGAELSKTKRARAAVAAKSSTKDSKDSKGSVGTVCKTSAHSAGSGSTASATPLKDIKKLTKIVKSEKPSSPIEASNAVIVKIEEDVAEEIIPEIKIKTELPENSPVLSPLALSVKESKSPVVKCEVETPKEKSLPPLPNESNLDKPPLPPSGSAPPPLPPPSPPVTLPPAPVQPPPPLPIVTLHQSQPPAEIPIEPPPPPTTTVHLPQLPVPLSLPLPPVSMSVPVLTHPPTIPQQPSSRTTVLGSALPMPPMMNSVMPLLTSTLPPLPLPPLLPGEDDIESPKEIQPVKSTKKDRDQRTRHLLADLPLPPELPGTDPSPPASPEQKTPPPSQPILKKRPKICCPRYGEKKETESDWGKRCVDKFDIIGITGEGTYGQVYKAKDKDTGEMVALKKVRLDNEKEGFPITAIREIKILRQLNHTSVVNMKEIVTDKQDALDFKKDKGAFYLVFEYMDHDLMGLLESGLVHFTDDHIKSFMRQLMDGLDYCHKKNFLHRDIKCSNILLNNSGQIKLADFGLARLYNSEESRPYTNKVITLWYRPPELLLGEERYSPAIDVWSCIRDAAQQLNQNELAVLLNLLQTQTNLSLTQLAQALNVSTNPETQQQWNVLSQSLVALAEATSQQQDAQLPVVTQHTSPSIPSNQPPPTAAPAPSAATPLTPISAPLPQVLAALPQVTSTQPSQSISQEADTQSDTQNLLTVLLSQLVKSQEPATVPEETNGIKASDGPQQLQTPTITTDAADGAALTKLDIKVPAPPPAVSQTRILPPDQRPPEPPGPPPTLGDTDCRINLRGSPSTKDPNAGVKAALLQLLNKEDSQENDRLNRVPEYGSSHLTNSYGTDGFRNNVSTSERRDSEMTGHALLDSKSAMCASTSKQLTQSRTLSSSLSEFGESTTYQDMGAMQFTADQDHRFNFTRVTLPALVTGTEGNNSTSMPADAKPPNYSYSSPMPGSAVPSSTMTGLSWNAPSRGSGYNRVHGRIPTRGGRGRGVPY